MKILTLCILALCVLLSVSQPNETVVRHHSYTTYYDAVTREPDSVVWDLDVSMVSCDTKSFPRKDAFKMDPFITHSAAPGDYQNSGYDKGHLFSYDDAVCNITDRSECFYMSNMLPQVHPFNAGDWKTLEQQERVFAKREKVHIIAGGCGYLGKLPAGEVIPAYMWKVVITSAKTYYFIMPNKNTSTGHHWDYWSTSKDRFDTQTGYKL